MRVLAPAKINLHLRVGPRRADGFHPLLTWMCTVGLFDNLVFERVRHQDSTLSCDQPGVPTDQANLILKAASALRAAVVSRPASEQPKPMNVGGFAARLDKRIPLGAGLGGGSSDGARTLLALNYFWGLGLGRARLEEVAATLGSDLSFFFHDPSAVCQGRGEVVQPIPPPRPRFAVLLLPGIVMPTPAVYRRFDELGLGRTQDVADAPDWSAWTTLPAADLLPRLVNDLEPPAFSLAPPLAHMRQQAEHLLARPVRMSGSGSSLFTLFDAEPEAVAAANELSAHVSARVIPVELAPQVRDDLHEHPAVRGTEQ